MSDLIVIFRTQSPIEADVVKGLLETHGIDAFVTSRHAADVRFRCRCTSCASPSSRRTPRAPQRIIESHRDDRVPAEGRPAPTFEPLEALIGYRFRDRGLLEHALTHRSRVHEDATGGVFDNESLEFLGDSVLGFVIADMLFREFPQHNEGQKSKLQGVDRLGELAGAAGRADRARLVSAPGARRGEDRRPPQARAHRRLATRR